MRTKKRDDRRDVRGVSNQVAVILLIGMVITGAVVISLVGTQSIVQLQDQVRGESSEKSMREIDARVSSLAVESSATRVTLDFGDQDTDEIDVVQSGYLNVSVDRSTQCTATVPLSSIRIDQGGGAHRAYEMGGIWVTDGDSSAMASPPQLRYDEGSIAITVTKFNGTINGKQEVIRKDVAASDARTKQIQQILQQGDCARPDNVTVTIKSQYYDAYHSYIKEEFNYTNLSAWDANQTVRVHMAQAALPASTNDSRNQVVNLNGAPYNNVTTTNNSIKVEKNAPVNYTLAVKPIAQGVEVSEIHDFEDQTIYRQPLDVVFVIDESGSMTGGSGSGDTKRQAAQDGMQTFLGLLNESRDRVGLVGFWQYADNEAHIYFTNEEYVTSDFDDMNDSIDDTEASGGTHLNAGMREAASITELISNSSRQRVIVALSDGVNDDENTDIDGTSYTLNDASEYWANRSQENGVTVYTIGFDDNPDVGDPDQGINVGMLKRMTHKGDGRYYYAENTSQLQEVFKAIAAEVTETEAVARPPVSVNISTGAQTYYPQISGETDKIANATGEDGETVLNVNDPTAPTFSFALTVPDGANISMNSLAYNCDRWEATSQTLVNQSANETYLVTRCAELDESSEEVLEPSRTSIYTDGDNISSLVDEREAWFQTDLNETLIPYRNGTTLELPSNQALVVFDYEDDDKANNRLVMLFQIGYAESQRSAGSVLDVTVNNVTVGG